MSEREHFHGLAVICLIYENGLEGLNTRGASWSCSCDDPEIDGRPETVRWSTRELAHEAGDERAAAVMAWICKRAPQLVTP